MTTTRVTHATPASGYSSSANRNWEGDSDMINVAGGCKDIARQLIEDNPDIQVHISCSKIELLQTFKQFNSFWRHSFSRICKVFAGGQLF